MVKMMAMGRLTQVLRKGMISAPEPGAVTTSTSYNATQPEPSCTFRKAVALSSRSLYGIY